MRVGHHSLMLGEGGLGKRAQVHVELHPPLVWHELRLPCTYGSHTSHHCHSCWSVDP